MPEIDVEIEGFEMPALELGSFEMPALRFEGLPFAVMGGAAAPDAIAPEACEEAAPGRATSATTRDLIHL